MELKCYKKRAFAAPRTFLGAARVKPQVQACRPPSSKGYFNPDFVAELEDGRQLIVEYKGPTDPDAPEKNNIGLKAEASAGTLLFLMTVKRRRGRPGSGRANPA